MATDIRDVTASASQPLPAALRASLLVIPIAGAALIGGDAAACFPEACEYYEQWTAIEPLNAAAIPIDGVLLLQATLAARPIDRVGLEGPLPHVTLAVTRDGEPVAGALEGSEVDQVIVWRPAAPLQPGATYEVTGSLDNAQGRDYCISANIPIEFEFHADDGPAAPLVAPTVGASERVDLRPRTGIDDLACCDGAYPRQGHSDCGPSDAVMWADGACTAIRGVGWLAVELSLTHTLPPATARLISRRVIQYDKPRAAGFVDTLEVEGAEPFCTQVQLRNLATGETVTTDEVCHGDAVAGQLGEQDIDPVGALAGQCDGPVYTCQAIDVTMFETKWDDAACLPWGEAEDGCDCASDSTGAAWWLAVIVPVLARRRRSRRRAG